MSEQQKFPNVLVLSGEIPQTMFAGGIVLHRLLSGYPKDRLLVIGQPPHPDARLLDCPYRFLQTPLRRLEKTRFSCHKKSLAAMGLIPLPSRRTITRLIGNFRPDVILCVMTGTPWLLTAQRTARELGLPLVLIVHDINEEFEKVFPWAKAALFRKNRDVYRSAARRLCVSPEMAAFLEKRYGVPGEVMYPNRSEELQPRPLAMSLTLRAAAEKLKHWKAENLKSEVWKNRL